MFAHAQCCRRGYSNLTLVCAADEKLDQAADVLHFLLTVGLGRGGDVGLGGLQSLRLLLQVLLQEPARNTQHEPY